MAVFVFSLSLLLSLILVPLVRQACLKYGFVAKPRDDRWHRKPTAKLGGVGIYAAFAISLGLSLLFWKDPLNHPGILIGSTMIFLLGLYDDWKRISPPAKLVGQILAATVVISFGYTTGFFTPRISDSIVAQLPNILLTYLWLIGITNAINLLDNMDGLAGGIALITAVFLSYFFWEGSSAGLLAISIALAGSALGFLVFNFPPASIFMGDSGSQLLGFTLAVLAIARQPQASDVFAVMGVPTLLFLLPILDTFLVTFTRLLRGQSPVQGGRDHTSHRLIAFGLSERQAVMALYAVAILSGIAAATLESLVYWFSLVLVPLLVISLALLTAYLGGLKVVSAQTPRTGRAITRIMMELTFKRRLLEVVLDFFLIGIAYYMAFLTRYGFYLNSGLLELFLKSFPIALAAAYISFYTFGVYRGVWRYIGLDDLVKFFKAVLGCVAITTAAMLLLYTSDQFSPLIPLLFGIYLMIGLATARSSFRVLDRIAGQKGRSGEERVLILGAGDAGEMALRWILMNPHIEYNPVGFLDADPFMTGRQIHGIEVLGGMDLLSSVIERKSIDGVIISCNLENRDHTWDDVFDVCQKQGCWVRTLRLEFELVE